MSEEHIKATIITQYRVHSTVVSERSRQRSKLCLCSSPDEGELKKEHEMNGAFTFAVLPAVALSRMSRKPPLAPLQVVIIKRLSYRLIVRLTLPVDRS